MDTLKRVINAFKLDVLEIENVPESFSSTVYNVKLRDHRLVYIKIPYSKVKRDRELQVLKRLDGHLPVPKVLDYWEGDEEVTGAFLLSVIDGVPISEKVDSALAFDIGVHHAKLHSIVPEESDYGRAVSNEYDRWTEFIKQQFYSFAEDVKKVIERNLFEQSLTHFHDLQQLLPPPEGPRFIHMDFRSGNILVNDNRVAGIIDFESVRIGATEIDFTKINRDIFRKYPGTMEAFVEGYRSIRPLIDLQNVLPFYTFIDAFNSIGWCKRRGMMEKNRAFVEQNYNDLKRILRS
ncbi:phosphotransferase family protein [Guptibacillus algicola]|uniref:phosphotransferase family protein n=1 Tax=Guptibacillus algicola TaxID=225844 RepID=UPI001CD4E7E4|nr:phosphotransferase [Alkalihalobacillus algicola]MCA0987337.1 phosphotransferase [Alkalihalobacillus algicola]